MKKRFHHIYIEITNRCNLACSFCPKTKRKVEDMSYENFCKIIDQAVEYTSMIYLHVMGEPLLHPNIENMIRYANEKGLMVGITTNGVLLEKHVAMFHDMNIKRINLSLHSYYDVNNQLHNQLVKTVKACDQILEQLETTIFYRLWDMDHPMAIETAKYLKEHYGCEDISLLYTSLNGISLKHRVRLQLEHKFTWPIDGENEDVVGFCQGLRSHIAILVNGDVIPCCLDNEGNMKLGNCIDNSLQECVESKLATLIYDGFSARKAVTSLCKQCEYKNRF